MKPYGVRLIEGPDVVDIQYIGGKSSMGQYRKKGGDFRGYSHGDGKASTRRYWKRKARLEGKKSSKEIEE